MIYCEGLGEVWLNRKYKEVVRYWHGGEVKRTVREFKIEARHHIRISGEDLQVIQIFPTR